MIRFTSAFFVRPGLDREQVLRAKSEWLGVTVRFLEQLDWCDSESELGQNIGAALLGKMRQCGVDGLEHDESLREWFESDCNQAGAVIIRLDAYSDVVLDILKRCGITPRSMFQVLPMRDGFGWIVFKIEVLRF